MSLNDVPRETIYDSGLDWITLTAKGKGNDSEELLAVFDEMHKRALEYGEEEKHQTWNTFAGIASDHLFYGRNNWGCMFRASSSSARTAAREIISRSIRANCTRIDAQSTVRTPCAVREYVAGCLRNVSEAGSGASGIPNRELATYAKTDGGSGFRIGSANSSRRGVVYDKTSEQRYRIDSRLVRFEARFGGIESRAMWDAFHTENDHDIAALDVAATYFRGVGIVRPWMEDAAPLHLPSSYKRQSIERSLDWMWQHWTKTAQKLVKAGHTKDLEKWLEFCKTGIMPVE